MQSDDPAREVVAAVDDLPRRARGDTVRRLFGAVHGLLGLGDAGPALRVLALCRRLDPSNAELVLAVAEVQCRAGDLEGARAGFRLARALARLRCADATSRDWPPGRPSHETRGCSTDDLRDAKELMVSSSARHGMCMMEARRFREAASHFREALAAEPVSVRQGAHALPSASCLNYLKIPRDARHGRNWRASFGIWGWRATTAKTGPAPSRHIRNGFTCSGFMHRLSEQAHSNARQERPS